MPTLVDSNVLIDIIEDDAQWIDWSRNALHEARDRGPILVNAVIYAEVSIGFSQTQQADRFLQEIELKWQDIPPAAAFLAGKAFRTYRQRGGTRVSTLPDFFIGAHAAAAGLSLLTRDRGRYETYFPALDLICP